MNFNRSTLVSILGVFGSAFWWLLSFKIVAYGMGPEGVGLFSQLRQMVQAVTIGATFGGTNPVVQSLSERQDSASREEFRFTASRIIGLNGAVIAIFIFMMAPQIASYFLASNDDQYIGAVRWLALAVLLNVGGTYFLAVLNGYRSYIFLALAQIAGPMAMMLFLLGGWRWGLFPSNQLLAVSFVICFLVTSIVAVFGVRRLPKIESNQRSVGLLGAERNAFMRFGISTLVAALSSSVVLLLIRSWMINDRGLAFAGLFDAGWTLTFNYTTLFLSACSIIYLPMLTAATNPQDKKACVLRTAYLVLGISIVVCFTLSLWNTAIIELLYSSQFYTAGQAVIVLSIAVMLRGISWVYGTMILAERKSRVLLVSDVTLNLLLLLTARFALDNSISLEALAWAFVFPHFIYLVFVVEYACKTNPLMQRRNIWPHLTLSVIPLLYLATSISDSSPNNFGMVRAVCFVMGIISCYLAITAYKKVGL